MKNWNITKSPKKVRLLIFSAIALVLLLLVGSSLLLVLRGEAGLQKLYGFRFDFPSDPPSLSSDTYTVFAASQGTLTWKRIFSHWSTDSAPKNLLINVQLRGPFPSLDAARSSLSSFRPSMQSPLISIKADEASAQTLNATLRFPEQPGYYTIVQWISEERGFLMFREYKAVGDYSSHAIHVIAQS